MDALYNGIARALREFGYGDVTPQMIRETDEARKRGAPKTEPHGIISLFAVKMLQEAETPADD